MRHASLVALAGLVMVMTTPVSAQRLPPAMERVDFREVVRDAKTQVFPAVIFIRTLRESLEGGRRVSQEISGSGVIISPAGEAITNWHVVDRATSVRCQLSDGRAMKAKVIGTDKSTDLALIQLEVADQKPLPFAAFGNSQLLQEGDFVMAMGAPWGMNRSVSIGIVSCTNRYLPETSEYSHWLQTDAAINPGNSGGPLVNTEGRVIGLNTRGMDFGDGMGFAVPSETIGQLLEEIRNYGRVRWSWLGLQLQPLRDFNRDTYFEGDRGVIVAATDPESPARGAGLQPRDRILSVNGEPLTAMTEEELPRVRRTLGFLPMHEAASFEVERGDDVLTVEVTPREKGEVQGEELDCPRWDLTIKAINQFENEDLFFYRKEGVFVYGVKYPGNASNAGLSANDIILKIDNQDVKTLEEVKAIHAKAIENVAEKPRIMLTVLRGGLLRQRVLDFSRDYSKD